MFGQLEQCALRLGPTGCHLFQRRGTFLGRVVSASGIRSDPEKVTAVAEWPQPADVSEMRTIVAWRQPHRGWPQGQPLCGLTGGHPLGGMPAVGRPSWSSGGA